MNCIVVILFRNHKHIYIKTVFRRLGKIMLRSKFKVEPCKPKHCIEPPNGKLYSGTHYNKDFKDSGKQARKSARAEAIRPVNTIEVSPNHYFYDETSYSKAFYKWLGTMDRTYPCLPKPCIEKPQGKVNSKSTYKKDYTKKGDRGIPERVKMIMPVECISPPKGQFYASTSYNNEYSTFDTTDKVNAILPRGGIDFPTGQIYSKTSYNKDYKTVDSKIRKNSKVKPIYPTNRIPMPEGYCRGTTTYTEAFMQWFDILSKAYPCKPKHCIDPQNGTFYNLTSYEEQFQDTKNNLRTQAIFPRECISPPHGPLYAQTTYCDEFHQFDDNLREMPIKPKECLSPPHGHMQSNTTYHNDFQSETIYKTEPIIPEECMSPPHGNVQGDTVYTTDYNRTLAGKQEVPIIPPECLSPPHGQFLSNTVYTNDYHGKCVKKETPILPHECLSPPHGYFNPNTTYRTDFPTDGQIEERVHPIKPKEGMSPPHGHLFSNTTYTKEFSNFGENVSRTKPIIPPQGLSPPKGKLHSKTVYKKYFQKHCKNKTRKPKLPKGNLKLEGGKVSAITTYNCEFCGAKHFKSERAQPIYPNSDLNMPSRGQFYDETTYSKTFTPSFTLASLY